jgi:hypothetical protein
MQGIWVQCSGVVRYLALLLLRWCGLTLRTPRSPTGSMLGCPRWNMANCTHMHKHHTAQDITGVGSKKQHRKHCSHTTQLTFVSRLHKITHLTTCMHAPRRLTMSTVQGPMPLTAVSLASSSPSDTPAGQHTAHMQTDRQTGKQAGRWTHSMESPPSPSVGRSLPTFTTIQACCRSLNLIQALLARPSQQGQFGSAVIHQCACHARHAPHTTPPPMSGLLTCEQFIRQPAVLEVCCKVRQVAGLALRQAAGTQGGLGGSQDCCRGQVGLVRHLCRVRAGKPCGHGGGRASPVGPARYGRLRHAGRVAMWRDR